MNDLGYMMQYITVKLLIADVFDSSSCILFIFAVTICHVSQFHCSDPHALSAMPMSKGKPYVKVPQTGRIPSEGKHTLDKVSPPPDNEGHNADCC